MENSNRIHKHLVLSALECLRQSFEGGYYIDKVLERSFKQNKKWGARDRRFVAESCYEIVRWWRKLWWIQGEEPKFDDTSLLQIFVIWLLSTGNTVPHWSELNAFPISVWKKKLLEKSSLGIEESIPEWIADKLIEELGEARAKEALHALNKQAEVVLRVNRIKMKPEGLKGALEKEGISTSFVDKYPDALVLSERNNVFRTNAFKMGYFEVQDGASQTIAYLLGVEPGMRVVDACAGAGGKSLHIASLMQNKGKILSLDIHEHKLNELKIRARRNSVSIIETRVIDGTKVIKRLADSADRLLLDVPCSGMGVLRRNPDTKWKLSQERIDELKQIQADILSSYSKMTKVGGQMLYATCSILKEENEEQVESFLAENKNWELKTQERHWPHQQGFDGFYAALLLRKS